MKLTEALFWRAGALTRTGISMISMAFWRKSPVYEVKNGGRDRVLRHTFSVAAA